MTEKKLTAKQAEVMSFANGGIPIGRTRGGGLLQGGEPIRRPTWDKIRRYFRKKLSEHQIFAYEFELTQTGKNKVAEYYRQEEEKEKMRPIEIDDLSKLPGWHPDHCCGMFCDGQDGPNTSECGRSKAAGPPADAPEYVLVGRAVEEAARMRNFRTEAAERRNKALQARQQAQSNGPVRGGIYRHHKNGMLYEVIGISMNTDDPDEFAVVYRALYDDFGLFHRPLAEFMDGRFTLEKETV